MTRSATFKIVSFERVASGTWLVEFERNGVASHTHIDDAAKASMESAFDDNTLLLALAVAVRDQRRRRAVPDLVERAITVDLSLDTAVVVGA